MEKKRELVIQDLLKIIREGHYSEDNRLPSERDLANQLKISRVSLREAIVALETMGILETRERLGTFVRGPEINNISENMRLMPFWPEKFLPQFLEVRIIIDVHAAELAAQRRTQEQLMQMKECITTLESISLETLKGVRTQAHYEYLFHNLVVESAHNAILSKIWEGLVFLVEKNNEIIHESLTEDKNWAPRVSMHHKTTLKAIEDMDPIGASNSMKIHLIETRERYLNKQNKTDGRYVFGHF